MRDAGLVTLSWITWGAWGLTLLLYILAATWAGQYAHGLAGYGGPDYLSVVQTSYAAFAFECLATAAWLFVILAHTYTVWRTPDNSINHPSRPHFLFYVTLAFLALSVLFGGIVVPALEGSLSYILGNESSVEGGQNIFGTYVAYTLFSVIATVLLLASVIITQKATRGAEESQSFNPLRWMLIIVVPLWIITEFVRFVLASMDMANFVVRYYNGTVIVFDPSLFMFGIASLATIAILPLAVVKVDNKKETEA
ncbi:hypothetical protein DL96DRAFT_1607849 [Flagelloscypha sp. PMI_526]|nr:hypothetical protein DL96DRAFT_1607849 [Flagelloscypha sp. PMI_526]